MARWWQAGRSARLLAGSAAILAGTVLGAKPADACELVAYEPLSSDGTHAGIAPGAAGPVTFTVNRGRGPQSSGCGRQSGSSCDDVGTLGLHFARAADMDSGPAEVGYRVDVVAGSAPMGTSDVPLVPFIQDGDVDLYLSWADGATDEQESLDFTLTITPVDSHGNEGPTSAPIHVQDGGHSGGGCAVKAADRDATSAASLALGVAAAAVLRRRGRRRAGLLGRFETDPGARAAFKRASRASAGW